MIMEDNNTLKQTIVSLWLKQNNIKSSTSMEKYYLNYIYIYFILM
jgi:hypothetical protein